MALLPNLANPHRDIESVIVLDEISTSIIVGSVGWPPSFVIVVSDLYPKQHMTVMTKYADDTYSMFGSRYIDTVVEEYVNIQIWVTENNLRAKLKR